MDRTTRRYLRDLAVGVVTTTRPSRGSQRWQPLSLKEELRETDEPFEGDESWEYLVQVNGMLLRKDGTVGSLRYHANYRDPHDAYELPVDELPDDIKALLVGPDGLRDWKRPAGLEATLRDHAQRAHKIRTSNKTVAQVRDLHYADHHAEGHLYTHDFYDYVLAAQEAESGGH